MSRWPFPGDSPVVQARKCAWAYRAALEELGKQEVVAELDERFLGWDQRWINPTRTYSLDDEVTADEGGPLIGISGGTLQRLRMRGRIKARLSGRTFLFKVRDIYDLSNKPRGRRKRAPQRTVTVSANGRSDS